MEEWRPVKVKGIEVLVSNLGRVKRVEHNTAYVRVRDGKTQVFTSKFREKILAPAKTKSGYLEVCPQVNGRRVKLLVHRLVGMAFCEGYEDGLHINHINGDKTDNRPENLEWVTNEDNVRHAWRTGLVNLRGERQPGAKLTQKKVLIIRRLLRDGVSAGDLAELADVSTSTIYFIRDGARWKDVIELTCWQQHRSQDSQANTCAGAAA